jgi:hypothetical protein
MPVRRAVHERDVAAGTTRWRRNAQTKRRRVRDFIRRAVGLQPRRRHRRRAQWNAQCTAPNCTACVASYNAPADPDTAPNVRVFAGVWVQRRGAGLRSVGERPKTPRKTEVTSTDLPAALSAVAEWASDAEQAMLGWIIAEAKARDVEPELPLRYTRDFSRTSARNGEWRRDTATRRLERPILHVGPRMRRLCYAGSLTLGRRSEHSNISPSSAGLRAPV